MGSNQNCIDRFVEGGILFLTYQRLGSLESNTFANADLNFAVLPYPKLDEFQKNYISTISHTTELGFVPITISMKNLDFVSAVVEYLNRLTAEIVMPKYYESTLKVRYARVPKNAEMIQLIHDSYANQFPLAWSLGDGINIFTTSFYDSIRLDKMTFSSFYRSHEKAAKTQLAQLISFYEDMRSEFDYESRQ